MIASTILYLQTVNLKMLLIGILRSPNTLDVTIEAKLDGNTQGSGRAVVIIGFKQQK